MNIPINIDQSQQFEQLTFARFATYSEAVQSLRDKGTELGFALNILYQYPSHLIGKVFGEFYCEKGRKAPDSTGHTNRSNCSFRAVVKFDADSALFRVIINNATHNHHMRQPTNAVAVTNDALASRVSMMRHQGLTSSQVMQALVNEGNAFYSFREIRQIGARTSAQADEFTLLFATLNEHQFLYNISDPIATEEPNRLLIQNVFFTKLKALEMFGRFPEVILFDTTYKTSASKMPLGAFVGIDNRNKSFLIGVVLLSNEKLVSFEFAIRSLLEKSRVDPNRIKTVLTDYDTQIRQAFRSHLPQVNLLVCRWHVRKNIIDAIRTGRRREQLNQGHQPITQAIFDDENSQIVFNASDIQGAASQRRSRRTSANLPDPIEVAKTEFNIMASQESEENFISSRDRFLRKYGGLSERVSGWFGADQVAAWAECYTRKFPRLGATTTSRAESSHAALKAHLNGASTLGHLVRTLNGMFQSTANDHVTLNYNDRFNKKPLN